LQIAVVGVITVNTNKTLVSKMKIYGKKIKSVFDNIILDETIVSPLSSVITC